jgi:hypothetical protein
VCGVWTSSGDLPVHAAAAGEGEHRTRVAAHGRAPGGVVRRDPVARAMTTTPPAPMPADADVPSAVHPAPARPTPGAAYHHLAVRPRGLEAAIARHVTTNLTWR